MASYYYPFGIVPQLQTVDYAFSASVADAAVSSNITVTTASFASAVVVMPSAGANGTNKNIADCTLTAPKGPRGPKGPTGTIAGTDLTTCPVGTVECTGLTPPAGYSIVCIQIPFGCPSGEVVCPPTLDGFASPTTTTTTTTTTTVCVGEGQPCSLEGAPCCIGSCSLVGEDYICVSS
jgi:hypothetical protein